MFGKLLINEPPLQVLPSLAEAIGLNEAVVLQQVHYLMNYAKFTFENKRWLYNSYEQWQSTTFRFWSIRTLQRIFLRLEELGLIESTTKFNRSIMNKTKWYTINYDAMAQLSQMLLEENQEQFQYGSWAMVQPTIEPDIASDYLEQLNQHTLESLSKSQSSSSETHSARMANYRKSISDKIKRNLASDDVEQSSFEQCDFDEAFKLFWSAGLVKVNEKKAKEAFIETFYSDWLKASTEQHPFLAQFPRTPEGYGNFLVKDIRHRIDIGTLGMRQMHPFNYLLNCRWKDEFVSGGQFNFMTEEATQKQKRREVVANISDKITNGGDWNSNEGWRRQLFFEENRNPTATTEQLQLEELEKALQLQGISNGTSTIQNQY